jgi:hypothetical protein
MQREPAEHGGGDQAAMGIGIVQCLDEGRDDLLIAQPIECVVQPTETCGQLQRIFRHRLKEDVNGLPGLVRDKPQLSWTLIVR